MRFSAYLLALVATAAAACSTATPPAGGPAPVPADVAVGELPAPATPAPVSPQPAEAPPRGTLTAEAAVASITADAVRRHVEFLASDELRGRDTPSPGLERAAEYLADSFRELGLRPAGDNGTFIQRFPLQDTRIDMAALRVQARHHGTTTSATFGDDFFVLPGQTDSVVGAPVFLGQARPGMTAPANIAGRIVMLFVPDTSATEQWQAAISAGLLAAIGGRAAAAVLVLDPDFTSASIAQLAQSLSSQVAPIPVVGLRYDVARSIFQHAGLDLGAIRGRTDGTTAPLQGVDMLIRTPFQAQSVDVPNVVAVLPGSDPALRNEYVVYSAHFDHVGVGAPDATGDSIYNGADDNASGTSAMVELARAFTSLAERPARSIMFVLVSAEEKGLLGSMYFVQNPPVPVTSMVANINADMIGRNAPDTVVAIGQDYSSLGPAVQRVAARHPELGLTVAPDLWPQEQLFFRSDHFSFAAREVPAIFFTTGLHEEYHQPSDRAQLIDNDKLARITRLLFHLGNDIANAAERPQWTAEGLAEVRRVTGGGQ